MALSTQEKQTILILAKYNLGRFMSNAVDRENFGAPYKEKERRLVNSNAYIKALEVANIEEMITEDEIEILYQRLICLLNIKTK